MATPSSTNNNITNPNPLSPETLQYRLQLSYLLAPLSKGHFATQPHLIESQETTSTPHSSSPTLKCPACQAALIVGVNAVARVHRTGLRQRCLGCRKVSKGSAGGMKEVKGSGQGRDRFLSVKQRNKKRKLEGATRSGVFGLQSGIKAIVGTSSRQLIRTESDTTASTRVQGDDMQGVEPTTEPSRTRFLGAESTSTPCSTISPALSKPNSTSKPIAPNPEPRAKPSPQHPPTTTTQDQPKTNIKRSKKSTKTSGLAALLAAKKLEREKANQVGRTSGGMGLQQFLQSM